MGARRYVKCYYCGEKIDRETEFNFTKMTNGRYAHDECKNKRKKIYNKTQETSSTVNKRDMIHNKVKALCGDAYVKTRVENQIRDNLSQGRTIDGILKSLDYWYDVQKHDPAEAHGGIGIVEYIYSEAQRYYARKEELKKNFDAIPQETIQKIIDNSHAVSPPCTKKERVTRPRHVVYFDLK